MNLRGTKPSVSYCHLQKEFELDTTCPICRKPLYNQSWEFHIHTQSHRAAVRNKTKQKRRRDDSPDRHKRREVLEVEVEGHNSFSNDILDDQEESDEVRVLVTQLGDIITDRDFMMLPPESVSEEVMVPLIESREPRTTVTYNVHDLYDPDRLEPVDYPPPPDIPGLTCSPFPPNHDNVYEWQSAKAKKPTVREAGKAGAQTQWNHYNHPYAQYLACFIARKLSEEDADELLMFLQSWCGAIGYAGPWCFPGSWYLLKKVLQSNVSIPV